MQYKALSFSLLLASPLSVFAAGSPWLLTPGETHLQTSFIYQTADEFNIGKTKTGLPDDLTQETLLVQVQHGINDYLALDFSTGYSHSNFDPTGSDSHLSDSSVGLTWRFHDEFISDSSLPSSAIRVGATIAGDYETGTIYSIGDGANALDISFLFGKVINKNLALSSDIGYRFRDHNVPDEAFLNLSSYFIVSPTWNLSLAYQIVDSQGDLDIGDPGFSPSRLPETEEDIQTAVLGTNYALSDTIDLGAQYAQVIDGRNTSFSDIFSLNVGIKF